MTWNCFLTEDREAGNSHEGNLLLQATEKTKSELEKDSLSSEVHPGFLSFILSFE